MNITRNISDELQAVFPDLEIYTENMEAKFKQQSCFIQQVQMTISPRLFDYQKRIYRYNISYFPSLEDTNADIEEMAEKLAGSIQAIEAVAWLFDREMQVVDDVLHFSFALEVHLKPEEKETFYQDLQVKGGLIDAD